MKDLIIVAILLGTLILICLSAWKKAKQKNRFSRMEKLDLRDMPELGDEEKTAPSVR